MIKNKRALSTVVTTLIIILLVLVAISIIWAVISKLVTTNSSNIDYSTRCLQINVKVGVNTSSCDSNSCDVIFRRESGGDSLDGFKLVFSNSTDNVYSDIIDKPIEIAPLQTKTETISITGLSSTPDRVDATPYILDDADNAVSCATSSYSF